MIIAMHEFAVAFRHTLREEMANWRIVGFTPDCYRLDDYPRALQPGSKPETSKVTHFEFRTEEEAENYRFDLAASHAMREVAKMQMRKLRAENHKKTQRRVARTNKGNPHVL